MLMKLERSDGWMELSNAIKLSASLLLSYQLSIGATRPRHQKPVSPLASMVAGYLDITNWQKPSVVHVNFC